jgi:monoamine oxidase
MARTPLMEAIRRAVAEVAAENGDWKTTRGGLLKKAGIAGLGLATVGRLTPAARAASSASIVVVGAGLAGLACAHRLKQAGYTAQVHEASDRVGGRCWTGREFFDQGQIYEHGGELIDQGHTHIRQLAQELGLNLDNLLASEVNGTEPLYFFDGDPYSIADATGDLKGIWQKLHKDVSAASYPTLFDNFTQRGFELDQLSIVDYLDETIPDGGASSKLGQLLAVAYNIEYGAESEVQSSLNLLYLLAYSGQGQLRIFGPSNEKYHVRGGNDQIPTLLAQALAGQITLGSELTAIKRNASGTFTLTFRQSSGTKTVTADHVVLTLPFSLLSEVNYSKAGFEPLKVTAIEELAMGTNSKLHLQFTERRWSSLLGCNGETFADTGYQNTWEVSRAQPGTAGILVNYTGGDVGASFGSGTPTSRAEEFLAQVEPVLPGLANVWNEKATVDFWAANPWTKGSYSYWKVGQYTKFSGMESRRQGNCHFAGEHTSQDFQGYLNGAVETGERAAGEVIDDLG